MFKRISCWFLFLLVFFSCADESSDEKEKLLKDLVKDEVTVEVELEKGVAWETDGKDMVLIPAGSFEMRDSTDETKSWMKPSKPVHRVEQDAFYMDVHEVTGG